MIGAMELWSALFDVLVLLFAALVLGALCEQLRQSPIIGYLAAGTLLGPNALKLISNAEGVSAFAELGVALLLFSIGLEFSWMRLRRLGGAALGGGTLQVVVTLALGAGTALLFGISGRSAIAVGAIVALSSTACVLRLLVARAEIESIHGRHALGILLVQDAAVVPLVLLVSVLAGEGTLREVTIDAAVKLGGAVLLIIVLYILFSLVAPRVLRFETVRRNRDLPILLTIVTGLGSAWAAHAIGLSPALGAFVAGMLLAASPFATQIRADIASIRTLLVTLFFSSIGMLGDPAWFVGNLPPVIALVLAIVIGKAIVIWIILRLCGLNLSNALATGICLAQVGEFSFVLAAVGRGTLISDELFTLIISATITTLFVTPYLVAVAPRVAEWTVGRMRALGMTPTPHWEDPDTEGPSREGHIVIIGFGPAGQAVGRSLHRIADRVAVIDLNPASLREARQHGFIAHIGDAMHADVLEHAGIDRATAVIVTIPDPDGARGVIELIRSIAPDAFIIARARYHRHYADLESGGAHEVIDEEQLIGARLAARLRKRLQEFGPVSVAPEIDQESARDAPADAEDDDQDLHS